MKDEGEMALDRVGGGFEGQRKGRANSGSSVAVGR